MKKILHLIVLCLLVSTLSGCMFINSWILKGDGKKLGGSYGLTDANADNLDVIAMRYLFITDQKIDKEILESLLAARISVDKDNAIKEVSFGPVTNFEPKNEPKDEPNND